MRVAILLNGLARKVEEGYLNYYKYIIDNYDTDVYLHFWEDPKHSEYEKVLKIYKNPKRYICEKPFSFAEYCVGIEVPPGYDSSSRPMSEYGIKGCFTSLPIFHGIQKVFSLVGEEYDCIVRGRYDIGGWPLIIPSLDLSKINVASVHWPGSEIPDDNLIVTDHTVAFNLYGNIFNEHLDIIRNEKQIYFSELNFLKIIQKKNLETLITKTPSINFSLLREFKVWH